MPTVYFVTHPEVVIDPATPVPDWMLSDRGIARMTRSLARPWMTAIGAVFCSAERKASDAAWIMAGLLGLAPVILAALGENDRTSTGYLPRAEFECVADAFFAHPAESVRGWERADDAQRRIVAAVDSAIRQAPAGVDIAMVSHGAVGALLLCHLSGKPIHRIADQPGDGGGNVFAFDSASRRLLHGWQPIEGVVG